jgi:hypothetical protein
MERNNRTYLLNRQQPRILPRGKPGRSWEQHRRGRDSDGPCGLLQSLATGFLSADLLASVAVHDSAAGSRHGASAGDIAVRRTVEQESGGRGNEGGRGNGAERLRSGTEAGGRRRVGQRGESTADEGDVAAPSHGCGIRWGHLGEVAACRVRAEHDISHIHQAIMHRYYCGGK